MVYHNYNNNFIIIIIIIIGSVSIIAIIILLSLLMLSIYLIQACRIKIAKQASKQKVSNKLVIS